MDGQAIWYIVGGGLVVGLVVLAAHLYERRRSEALQQAAMRLGLAFQAKDESIGMQPFASFPLFRMGRNRRFRNVARSDDLWLFGYSYSTGNDKNRSTHQQSVAAVRLPHAELPAFALSPEGFLARIGNALGAQDIDFEEDAEFSRRYHLRGDDEAAVRSLFTPALRQHLAMDPGWSVEGAGEWVILYRKRKRISPDDLATFAEHARRFSELIERGRV